MGKKLFCFLMILVSACSKSEIIKQDYSYNDLESYLIKWNDLFNQKESDYLVYIYDEKCGHCEDIKKEIIPYILNIRRTIFCINEPKDYVIGFDIESTIGVYSIESFFILGTPTLVEIKNHKVNKNIAGVSKIRDFIS